MRPQATSRGARRRRAAGWTAATSCGSTRPRSTSTSRRSRGTRAAGSASRRRARRGAGTGRTRRAPRWTTRSSATKTSTPLGAPTSRTATATAARCTTVASGTTSAVPATGRSCAHALDDRSIASIPRGDWSLYDTVTVRPSEWFNRSRKILMRHTLISTSTRQMRAARPRLARRLGEVPSRRGRGALLRAAARPQRLGRRAAARPLAAHRAGRRLQAVPHARRRRPEPLDGGIAR